MILCFSFAATFLFSTPADAQETKFSLKDKLTVAAQLLKSENVTVLRTALVLGIEYGKQAKVDEANGDTLAHERAAYSWGYDVGDPNLVKLIRLYWEGVQLGVFAFGDFKESKGEKSENWKKIESLVGGNGKEYEVNKDYINDIFHDVDTAYSGAEAAQNGLPLDFESFAKEKLSQ